MEQSLKQYEVVIVGGGPAGLNAALVLGRARRRVLLCDRGEPRNAPAASAHNFLSRDGTPPLQLLQLGREQLHPYTSVEYAATLVEDIIYHDQRFELKLENERQVTTRKLILATGVYDELPSIPGLREMWGKSVANCPYCHGWEVRDRPLAIVGNGEMGFHLARLLTGWSCDLILCTNGPSSLTDDQRKRLQVNEIPIREEPIVRLEGNNGFLDAIVFAGESRVAREGIFMRPPQRQRSVLAERLGCSLTPGGLIRADEMGRTEVPGVYAAGDAAQQFQSVIVAAASGASAAAMVNHELVEEDFG